MIRQIAYWEDAFEVAVKQLTPNVICGYAHELAAKFNHFYGACPISTGSADKLQLRLWLTWKFKDTCQKALHVLGMPTPRRM